MNKDKNIGFSLVELSIVLVILGLLVGGVLTGKSLIAAAQLRAVTKEFTDYRTAITTFREKYFGLPGDVTNAVAYWGAAGGGTANGYDATCAALTTSSAGAASTCNGNGDGMIGAGSYQYERFRAWQQLANAGLVAGNYTAVAGSAGSTHDVVGANVPASRYQGAGWALLSLHSMSSGSATYFAANYGNTLAFGANAPAENDYVNNPVISANESWNIDTKMDDGNPQSGIVLALKNASRSNCTSSTNDAYTVASPYIGCNLLMITGL